jgi:hypothetical protein
MSVVCRATRAPAELERNLLMRAEPRRSSAKKANKNEITELLRMKN